MKTIIKAKTAGFCFGVQRAVDLAIKTAETHDHNVITFGPLIHNQVVIDELEKQGICAKTSDLNDHPLASDKTVLIRAHGVGKETEKELKKRYAHVVDATCPFVKRIHKIVEERSNQGEQIVIIGSYDHPEVIGIKGWVNGPCFVVSEAEDALKIPLDPRKKVCIVAQTTFRFNKFQELVEIIKEKVYDIFAENTICKATEERQAEATTLAKEVDAMLVLGSKDSSNSKKLYEICKSACPCTYFLQTPDDLKLELLSSKDRIGITAGASTPQSIIEEVLNKCQTT